MNAARHAQWKRAFAFQTNELSTLRGLIAAASTGAIVVLFPGHFVLVFAIVSIAFTLYLQFFIVRPEDRRLVRMLCVDTLTILSIALIVHFTAR